jgi:(1->4)-alpha-D-glucan 1-alpha-D-glucosylmutase
MHGYDVIDFGELDPEIGTEAEFDRLVAALHRHEMGLIVDFVPNHMGIASGGNAWWQEVLENGQASPVAATFDIDWQPVKPELQNQVLLPVLGDHFGIVLENGELQLRLDQGAFTIWYYSLPLPVAPPTYPLVLRASLVALTEQFAADDLDFLELQSIVAAFDRLPAQNALDPALIEERAREQLLTKRRLAQLIDSNVVISQQIEATIRELNGSPGDPRTFDALDELISAQSYRLSYWRVAAEEINYRRFFAINELAAIRQEVPDVFAATHKLLLKLFGEGNIDGIRIDHPDGLWDPRGYFRDLQRAAFVAKATARMASDAVPADELENALSGWWDRQYEDGSRPAELLPAYLVVEKILEHGETVPDDWPVDGTVGYEFAQATTGLFVDSANAKAFDELYHRFAGDLPRFADLVYSMKQLIMRVALVSELNVLARALDRLSEHHRRTRDYTYNAMRLAMREIIACFPVYRTYTTCDPGVVTDRDRGYIQEAVRQAIRRNPATDRDVFAFVRDVLLLEATESHTPEQLDEQCRFIMKFQQLTGPVMAKGLEDTVFYIYNRLTSLNEVGGDPGTFGTTVPEFHRQNAERARSRPYAMLTSSTHDTKRSEDVRARISALSEMPKEWRAAINRWSRLNKRFKARVDGSAAPDRNDEYLFYQSLLGIWPAGAVRPDAEFIERIEAYMLKAIHEAQVHTSWISPNEGYDSATSEFVRSALANSAFIDDFARFHPRIALTGAVNGLSQQLLKLTSPGVPDIYQGTELWDFSLVDPDNRRPVDYQQRTRTLSTVRRRKPSPTLARELTETFVDGRCKLYLTQRLLAFRAEHADLFRNGDYTALPVAGTYGASVIAYSRRHGDEEIIVVAPRLIGGLISGDSGMPLGDVWADTSIGLSAGGSFISLLTGERFTIDPTVPAMALAEILAFFPVACLVRSHDRATSRRRSRNVETR